MEVDTKAYITLNKEKREMNKRIKIVFAVTVVLAMVLSACEKEATKAPAEEKTKVAVMFPGVVTDQSWNQFG